MNEHQGNPAFYDLKPQCKACPLNLDLEDRPSLCRIQKCPQFTPCSKCQRNLDCVDGLCVSCVTTTVADERRDLKEAASLPTTKAEDIAKAIARADQPLPTTGEATDGKIPIVPRPEGLEDCDLQLFEKLSDPEKMKFARRMRELRQILGDNRALSEMIRILASMEVEIVRLENLMTETKHPTRAARYRETWDSRVKLYDLLMRRFSSAESMGKTQYDEALSSALMRHADRLAKFHVGIPTPEEMELAKRKGIDITEFTVGYDGRLVPMSEAIKLSEENRAEFRAAIAEKDKKKAVRLMVINCLRDPVIAADTILEWQAAPHQGLALRRDWVTEESQQNDGAGCGKSVGSAVVVALRSTLMEGRRTLITSTTFKQAALYHKTFRQFMAQSALFFYQVAWSDAGKIQSKLSLGQFLHQFKNTSEITIIPSGISMESVFARGYRCHDLVISECNRFKDPRVIETVFYQRCTATWLRGWDLNPIFQNHIKLEGTPRRTFEPHFARVKTAREHAEAWRRARCKETGATYDPNEYFPEKEKQTRS